MAKNERGPPPWTSTFLEALARTRSVNHAGKSVGINRRTLYETRDRYPEFAAQWDDALASAVDELEASALKRAIEGVPEAVLYKGRPVMVAGHDGKEQPLIVRRYETALTIFMLKALRPEKYFLEKQLELGEQAAFLNAKRIRQALDSLDGMVPGVDENVSAETKE